MKNSLLEEFNIPKKSLKKEILTDYDIFPDKKLLDVLRAKIIENVIDSNVSDNLNKEEFINAQIESVIAGYDVTNLERSHIYNLIENEIDGYGPLTEVLEDDNITEIMVNSPKDIYIEINGQIIKDESISFINNEHIIRTIQKMISPLGRTIDASNPMVDSRLENGARINAVIPPLAVKGPVITIRKFQNSTNSIEDLIRVGSLTPWMARFLEAAIKGKLNILISGGSGTGKTSLLNTLSTFIDNHERIITIEDASELRLNQKHVISLETKLNNYDKNKEITVRDLVTNALRMRPDRIIIGEVRGKEAFDMLQAMNTGHDGSITTMHANSPADALNRLETMVLMSGLEIPIKAVREYIKNALDILVHIERMSDGKRKITHICEVNDIIDNQIVLSDIFTFKQNGLTTGGEVDGEFAFIPKIPKVYQKLKMRGITLIDDMFENLGPAESSKPDLPFLKNK